MFTKIIAVWKLISAVRKEYKEIDGHFTRELGQQHRLVIEAIAVDLINGKGNHWIYKLLLYLGLNDNAGEYIGGLLKSNKIDKINNGSTLERASIEAELRAVNSKFSGPHQP